MHFAFGNVIITSKKEEDKNDLEFLKEEEKGNSEKLEQEENNNSEKLEKEENNNSEKFKKEIFNQHETQVNSKESQIENVDENEETNANLEEWKIYPCHRYDEEYKDCKSARARFHQLFVFGEHIDCQQWKTDSINCWKWKKSGDQKAYEELLQSVNNRRLERFKPHFGNTVWKKRDKPPTNWNPPLPEWAEKKMKCSYVTLTLEKREKSANKEENSTKSCCIL